MPFDFIDQVQVKTGGYEAEFGQATGGVVNVITKSGTNVVRGSAFGYLHPSGLEKPPTQYQSNQRSVQTEKTHTETAGWRPACQSSRTGLFFFGAVDPSHDGGGISWRRQASRSKSVATLVAFATR
jgi:outer membrane receptor protein involved in Fe transport